MKRFFFAAEASRDLDEILTYLNSLPERSAMKMARDLQKAITRITDHPHLGVRQSELTSRAGIQVRSWLSPPYRIFYTLTGAAPEIVAILHTSRDIKSILSDRFQ